MDFEGNGGFGKRSMYLGETYGGFVRNGVDLGKNKMDLGKMWCS